VALFGQRTSSATIVPPSEIASLLDLRFEAPGIFYRGGKYFLFYEIVPVNFHLRTEEEQTEIIVQFEALLRALKRTFQIVTVSTRANVQEHLDYMLDVGEHEQSDDVRRIIVQYLLYAKKVTRLHSVIQRFALVLPHNSRAPTMDSVFLDYAQTMATLRQILRSCGNDVMDAMGTTKPMQGFFSAMVSGGNEAPLMHVVGVKQRVLPSVIDDLDHRYLKIDDAYVSSLLVRFPTSVKAAWLSDIISMDEGIDISFHAEPLERGSTMQSITRQIGLTRAKIASGQSEVDRDVAESSVNHALHIRRALSEGDDLWNMMLIIRARAPSLDELDDKLRRVEAKLIQGDMASERATYRQLDTWLTSLLGGDTAHHTGWERNILTSGLASVYPFTAFQLSDPSGVMLGLNADNDSPVIIDLFNTKAYNNANACILGSSGSGKTYLELLFAGRMRLQGIPVIMICPFKGFEYKRYCESIGGRYLKIAPGSPHTLNMLEIRPEQVRGAEDSVLAAKLQKLRMVFNLMLPDLTFAEQQQLDELLLQTYMDCGITMDNLSLFDVELRNGRFPANPKLKRMPTLGDLYERMQGEEKMQEIAAKLRPYVSGSLSVLNGQTNIDLDNKFLVIDVSDMPDEAIALAMVLILDVCWDRIKHDVTEKKAIFIDEAWRLIGAGGTQATADFVLDIFKTVRGFGGAAVAATQDISDFFTLEDGKYGRALLNNAHFKFVLPMQAHEARILQTVMDLSKEEFSYITHSERGYGLLHAGGNHITIRVQASPEEHALITTDRADLAKIKAKERA
jgi:Type IV secretory pathway, VirB4 components